MHKKIKRGAHEAIYMYHNQIQMHKKGCPHVQQGDMLTLNLIIIENFNEETKKMQSRKTQFKRRSLKKYDLI